MRSRSWLSRRRSGRAVYHRQLSRLHGAEEYFVVMSPRRWKWVWMSTDEED